MKNNIKKITKAIPEDFKTTLLALIISSLILISLLTLLSLYYSNVSASVEAEARGFEGDETEPEMRRSGVSAKLADKKERLWQTQVRIYHNLSAVYLNAATELSALISAKCFTSV